MANIQLKLIDPETLDIHEKGELGMFIKGTLVATYGLNYMPGHARVIENMLSKAFELGKKERSSEIKKLLGL